MSQVSIIIRTKNEERWIGHCLKMVFAQDFKGFEVIIVDNESGDHTLEVARHFSLSHTLSLSEYRPGLALNLGIRKSKGDYIVCLSAHCIPQSKKWLSSLIKNVDDRQIAGAYGRQLPVSFSGLTDKRDLLNVFGLDRRVQIKDSFFHNANSVVRRDVWEKIPFDESVTNIEDRIWAKAAIDCGYRLVYDPDAAVYHYHGIHRDNDPERLEGVVSVMERFETEASNDLPESLKPENCNVAAVVPVLGKVREVGGHQLLAELIEKLKTARYVDSVYVLSESEAARDVARRLDVRYISRPHWLRTRKKGVKHALKYALLEIEGDGNFAEVILFANYLFPFRPEGFFDQLIRDLQYKGLDTVFAAYRDYENYWAQNSDGKYVQVGEHLKPMASRQPLYRALYGLGSAVTAATIRSGKMIGERIGILPVDDVFYTLKCIDEKQERLAEIVLREIDRFRREQ